jgi:hypothetical protein
MYTNLKIVRENTCAPFEQKEVIEFILRGEFQARRETQFEAIVKRSLNCRGDRFDIATHFDGLPKRRLRRPLIYALELRAFNQCDDRGGHDHNRREPTRSHESHTTLEAERNKRSHLDGCAI